MIINIKELQEVEGGIAMVAFIRQPEQGSVPGSEVGPRTSTKGERAAAYEVDLKVMGELTKTYNKERAEYTHLHLGDAELIQKGDKK